MKLIFGAMMSAVALAAPQKFGLVKMEFNMDLLKPTANPTHYGDPATGCMTDEQAVQVTGVDGDFCTPPCTGVLNKCPTDLPKGATAKPQCALQTSTGEKYCALICDPSGDECGTATCKAIQGTGLCTYDDR